MPPVPTSIRALVLLLGGLAVASVAAAPAGATSLAYQGSDGTTIQQYLETLPDGVTQALPSGNTFVITGTDAGQYHACRRFVVLRQGGVGGESFACRDPVQPVWFVADRWDQIPPQLRGTPAMSVPGATVVSRQQRNNGFFDDFPIEGAALLALGILAVAAGGGSGHCP